jgi:hypothetical protein
MSETEPREQSESEPREESEEDEGTGMGVDTPEGGEEGAVGEQGGEGRTNVEGAPDISGDEQESGQTSHPAPDDDVGVPSDEEMSGEGENPSGE